MSRVVLSRLWYIFPADDQNLSPDAFSCKVKSYLNTLSPRERSALIAFLVAQYEMFREQLELLFAHACVPVEEYHERAERLARHVANLRACRPSLDRNAHPSLQERMSGFDRDGSASGRVGP